MANPQVAAYAERQNTNLDAIGKGIDNVAADVAWQAKELARWNSLPPTWTPEDQSILDGLIARTGTLTERVAALDALTDVPAEPPVEPPTEPV